MTPDDPRDEFAAFLRHHRGRVAPEQVGLPRSSGRRVPGLRREELAIVSGVSPDHYQRVEQGRVRPSAQVIDAIATALGLDGTERAHLQALARNLKAPPTRAHPASGGGTSVRGLQELVDSFAGPAFALNPCRDVLAWNRLGAALITDFSALQPRDRNMAWLVLTDPRMRDLYPDWKAGAQGQVALLRHASAKHPGDARMENLIGRLATASPEFAEWWPQQQVMEKTSGTKALNHPGIGPIELGFHVLRPAASSDIELVVYFASTDEERERLTALAKWSSETA
ncbi:helix-turn-helix transcriptional regulator [Actinomadura rupiterrae]|uniref:helix-turn-helix transcriptional regulator n=1 Tax=Actinomadura rupiterrae TaxID=559627 RepID=UPI0020A4B259|nr:helix-turn-helix transcriptional regulator [Actinomadura rupiterrae]MCP2338722.1 transcriptional regulator with XRE-family HTH domain [Actinomadura rupiterrae]